MHQPSILKFFAPSSKPPLGQLLYPSKPLRPCDLHSDNKDRAEQSPPVASTGGKVEEARKREAGAADDDHPPLSSAKVGCVDSASSSGSDTEGSFEEDAGPSVYEQEREARIAENRAIMMHMGLDTAWQQLVPPPKRAKRPSLEKTGPVKRVPVRAYPLRSRAAGRTEGAAIMAGDPQPETEASPLDDTVRQYVCSDAAQAQGGREECYDATCPADQLTQLPGCWADSALPRIYSLHTFGSLLAAGGKGGIAAVFGRRIGPGGTSETCIEPLRSAKLHTGWIADVQLIGPLQQGSKPDDGLPLLLSASNDARLCLWDLQKATQTGGPSCIAEIAPHAGGIFSMHEQNGCIVTASKDGSVALTDILPSGGLQSRELFAEHHSGVVKCARFSSTHKHIFASCGNDRCIRLTDTRSDGNSGMTIPEAHGSAISFLRWHPVDKNLIISTAFEPAMHLFDLRRGSEPLHRFTGHSQGKVSAFLQPAFVAGGQAIVTGGQRSTLLSMYCTNSGKTISRGEAGHEVLAVHAALPDLIYCASGRNVLAYRV